jgi:hypothetical protein
MTHSAGPNEVDSLVVGGPRATIGADLHDTLGTLSGFHHFSPLNHRQTQRLFHIDVFAGVASINEHEGMPVVRRGDDHCLDVLVFDQLAVLLMLSGCGARFLYGKIHVIFAEITKCYCLAVLMFQKSIVKLVASITEADITHAYSVIGPENTAVAERCGRQGSSSEVPASQFGHEGLS